MKEDSILFLAVFAVWALLAVLYATVPMFAMPGYAAVWGWGSLVFLALAALIVAAERRSTHQNRD